MRDSLTEDFLAHWEVSSRSLVEICTAGLVHSWWGSEESLFGDGFSAGLSEGSRGLADL
jgi:hypothetical protein